MLLKSRPLSLRQRLYFSIRHLRLFLPFYFAHHPLCDDFSQETISYGDWVICRGCTLTYVSLLFVTIIDLFLQPFKKIGLLEGLALVLLLTSPVWIGLFYSFQSRTIKDILRIVLGSGWGISMAELWLRPGWPDKVVILLGIVGFWLLFVQIRRIRNKKNMKLCSICPQKSDTVCDGFKRQFEAEIEFNREVDTFLWENLKNEGISLVKKTEGIKKT